MSYRDNLKVQIKELEDRISKSKNDSAGHVAYLEKLLNTLKIVYILLKEQLGIKL